MGFVFLRFFPWTIYLYRYGLRDSFSYQHHHREPMSSIFGRRNSRLNKAHRRRIFGVLPCTGTKLPWFSLCCSAAERQPEQGGDAVRGDEVEEHCIENIEAPAEPRGCEHDPLMARQLHAPSLPVSRRCWARSNPTTVFESSISPSRQRRTASASGIQCTSNTSAASRASATGVRSVAR